jgi:transposase
MDGSPKKYRAWDSQQGRTLTTSPEDALPEDDLAFFLLDTIPTLDLSAFHARYTELRGQPPYDVTLLVTLLVYAYCLGLRSSRKIAAACERNRAFRAIVGDQRPNFRTISDFRKRHLKARDDLLVKVLRLAGEVGLVNLGNVATDGTKMGADASRHKAMSYAYMGKERERLREEIQNLLAEAEQVDTEQDAVRGSRRWRIWTRLGSRSRRMSKVSRRRFRTRWTRGISARKRWRSWNRWVWIRTWRRADRNTIPHRRRWRQGWFRRRRR